MQIYYISDQCHPWFVSFPFLVLKLLDAFLSFCLFLEVKKTLISAQILLNNSDM